MVINRNNSYCNLQARIASYGTGWAQASSQTARTTRRKYNLFAIELTLYVFYI